jgi:transcription elongation factor Elf1
LAIVGRTVAVVPSDGARKAKSAPAKKPPAEPPKLKTEMYCIKCGLETVPGTKIRPTAPAIIISGVSLSIAFYSKGKALFESQGEMVLVGFLLFGVLGSILSDVLQSRTCRSCGSEELVATASPRARAERSKLEATTAAANLKTKGSE